jgi:hypothetical protein
VNYIPAVHERDGRAHVTWSARAGRSSHVWKQRAGAVAACFERSVFRPRTLERPLHHTPVFSKESRKVVTFHRAPSLHCTSASSWRRCETVSSFLIPPTLPTAFRFLYSHHATGQRIAARSAPINDSNPPSSPVHIKAIHIRTRPSARYALISILERPVAETSSRREV